MVLSIRAHELLTQNSKNNSLQNDFKSLIPQNDIPDKKQVYHKNMLEISEKTIELKSKKTFKKREEIVIDKVEIDSEEDVEEESDDLDEVEDTLQFKLDDDSDDLEVEAEGVKEEEGSKEEEAEEEGSKEEEEKDDDNKKLPEKDLMLDLIGFIEDKNKKEEKKNKEKPVEIELKDNNTKNIVVDVPEDIEQNGGNVKKIKLDQHYNFF